MTTANEGEAQLKPLLIARKQPIADGVTLFELRDPAGASLPPFTPGSHVSVRVPSGLVRKYSLCSDPADTDRYELAVKRENDGRGGSRSLIDDAAAGQHLPCGLPANEFPLDPKAKSLIFIAGGIGITPILSMIRHLQATQEARWRLIYLTRSPGMTAFRDVLSAPELSAKVEIHHDGGDPDRAFDLWPLLEKPKGEHVYCCGPRALMEAVRDMTGHWSTANVHFEDFGGDRARAKPDDKPFRVRLARVGRTVEVPPGMTALDAMRLAGASVPSSCESGTCGSCKCRILAGTPDHRDLVLADHEKADFFMPCVSRALSEELELDV